MQIKLITLCFYPEMEIPELILQISIKIDKQLILIEEGDNWNIYLEYPKEYKKNKSVQKINIIHVLNSNEYYIIEDNKSDKNLYILNPSEKLNEYNSNILNKNK